jgi:hypothetical protein
MNASLTQRLDYQAATLREGDVLKLGNVIVKVVKIKFALDDHHYDDEVKQSTKIA